MVRQCHLVEAELLRAAAGGCTAEIGTGKAGAAAFFCVCRHYVNIVTVVCQAELRAEGLQLCLGKVVCKHAVDGVAGKVEGNRRIFFDFRQHGCQKHAVLATAEADENAVARLQHIEFYNSPPQLAQILGGNEGAFLSHLYNLLLHYIALF